MISFAQVDFNNNNWIKYLPEILDTIYICTNHKTIKESGKIKQIEYWPFLEIRNNYQRRRVIFETMLEWMKDQYIKEFLYIDNPFITLSPVDLEIPYQLGDLPETNFSDISLSARDVIFTSLYLQHKGISPKRFLAPMKMSVEKAIQMAKDFKGPYYNPSLLYGNLHYRDSMVDRKQVLLFNTVQTKKFHQLNSAIKNASIVSYTTLAWTTVLKQWLEQINESTNTL